MDWPILRSLLMMLILGSRFVFSEETVVKDDTDEAKDDKTVEALDDAEDGNCPMKYDKDETKDDKPVDDALDDAEDGKSTIKYDKDKTKADKTVKYALDDAEDGKSMKYDKDKTKNNKTVEDALDDAEDDKTVEDALDDAEDEKTAPRDDIDEAKPKGKKVKIVPRKCFNSMACQNHGGKCVKQGKCNTREIPYPCSAKSEAGCACCIKKMKTPTINPTSKKPCHTWAVNRTKTEKCKRYWVKIRRDCLFLSKYHDAMTFDEAQDYCRKKHRGADLAIQPELEILKEYLKYVKGSPLTKQLLWVGGSDSCTPGEPRWLDASPIEPDLWDNEELSLKDKGNVCLVVDVDREIFQNKPCTEKYNFICQKSADRIYPN